MRRLQAHLTLEGQMVMPMGVASRLVLAPPNYGTINGCDLADLAGFEGDHEQSCEISPVGKIVRILG